MACKGVMSLQHTSISVVGRWLCGSILGGIAPGVVAVIVKIGRIGSVIMGWYMCIVLGVARVLAVALM